MIFPAYGDAANYLELGEACAKAMRTKGGVPWNACYDSIRPLGLVGYQSLPYLLFRDPVDRSYFFLFLNLGWATLAILSLVSLFVAGVPARYSRPITAIVAAVLLVNVVPHLPITLADLPSLALFIAAIHQSARVLRGHRNGYFLAGLLVALACSFKQTYLAHGFFLLCVTLLFDPVRFGMRDRAGAAVKFAIGAAPVLVQVAWIYFHSGDLWFYEKGSTIPLDRAMRPNIEGSFTTLPQVSAFMVKVANDVSYPTFLVLKMFRGLFGFEWAVWGGYVKHSPLWVVSTAVFVKAWLLVIAWAAVTIFTIVRGSPVLRLLNTLMLVMVAFLAVSSHVELRYYILPRVVMWGTAAAAIAIFLERRRQPVPAGSEEDGRARPPV